MAVTHADLAPSRRKADLGSKTGAFLMVLCIIFGLVCFILALLAEATRSEVNWSNEGNGGKYQCSYTGSGKTPLLCATSAFVALAFALVVEHTYILAAVSNSPALVAWDPISDHAKTLTWQAGFFFVTTWICFAVGEILLLIGLSVESGHLQNWSAPRESCLIIKQGLFSAAGVFGLMTVFLASGLYITTIRAERLLQELEHVRREILEASEFYASPPQSPPRHTLMAAVANESAMAREDRNFQPLSAYLSAFDKSSNLV